MGKAIVIMAGGGTDTEEGNPNANPAYILSGYTVYGKDGEIVKGTLATKTLSQSLNAGGSVTVPAGYYTGADTNKVTANSLSSQTSATAGAGQVLKDYTGWKDGSKITGTMVNRGAISQSLSANGTYTVPAGWHNGSGKVTQSLTTQAAKTITPGTSQQTIISASVWTTGVQTVSGNSNLVAGNIKKGVTIFGVSGTIDSFIGGDYTIMSGGTFSAAGAGMILAESHYSSSSTKWYNTIINPSSDEVRYGCSKVGTAVTKSGSGWLFKMSYYDWSGSSNPAWGWYGGTWKFKLPIMQGKKMTLSVTITSNARISGLDWKNNEYAAGVAIHRVSQVDARLNSSTSTTRKAWMPKWSHLLFAASGAPNSSTRTIKSDPTATPTDLAATEEVCIVIHGYAQWTSNSNDKRAMQAVITNMSISYT